MPVTRSQKGELRKMVQAAEQQTTHESQSNEPPIQFVVQREVQRPTEKVDTQEEVSVSRTVSSQRIRKAEALQNIAQAELAIAHAKLKEAQAQLLRVQAEEEGEYEEHKLETSRAFQDQQRTEQWVENQSNYVEKMKKSLQYRSMEKETGLTGYRQIRQPEEIILEKKKIKEEYDTWKTEQKEKDNRRWNITDEDWMWEPEDEKTNDEYRKNPVKKTEDTSRKPEQEKIEDSRIDLKELASAIALAARSGPQTTAPRYTGDLPFFNGAHEDWLAFRAAYIETEKYYSEVENTSRLRRSLKGKAQEAVRRLLIADAKPDDIMKSLETMFGRPDSIALSELKNLRCLERLTDAPGDICMFANKIQNSIATLKVLKRHYYLYNPEVVKNLVEKLTPTLRFRWFDFAVEQPEEEPDLIKFGKFMEREASRCGKYAPPEIFETNETYRRYKTYQPIRGEHRREPHRTLDTDYRRNTRREFNRNIPNTRGNNYTDPRRSRIYVNSEQKREYRVLKTCPLCQKTEHDAEDCKKFKEANCDKRWDLAKEYNLCFRCLKKRTQTHKCRSRQCNVNECERTHHPLLHFKDRKKEESEEKISTRNDHGKQRKEETEEERVTTNSSKKQYAFLKIIPVQITGPEGTIETYALLDDGSTVTLIDSKVAKEIGCKGPIDPLRLEVMAGVKLDTGTSRRVSLKIQGTEGTFPLKARTIDHLKLAPQTVNARDLENCRHLEDIKDRLQYQKGFPTILIGQDNWQFLVASAIRRGPVDQPVASLTPLGWVLHGVNTRSLGRQVNYCYLTTTMEDKIDEEMKRYFAMDSLGVMPRTTRADPEKRALNILQNKTVERPEGGYETALLWKRDDIKLPNNYDQALKRLHGIEKKLDKDPTLKISYEKQIDDLIKKGYAEEASSPPKPDRTWYLPHFAVLHPSKPGKVRVVYDAAAKSGGTSLNDNLLSGPDLLQSLPGVLMRFRQHPIAVAADIEEMFLRIGILEEDRDALRFLWRHDRREGPATEYRMKSVIFGAASSPCTALYVKNFNAEKHKEKYPEAAEAIISHHYMDDYLQSFESVEEAIKISNEVRMVHKKGNFNLRKWTSNKPEVLNALKNAADEITDEVKLDDGSKEEKILGLIWKPCNDTLSFNLNFSRVPEDILKGTRIPTKREALKTVMSLYDPLGLVSPVTIQAKQILQETWRHGTGWDEELPKEAANKWKIWLNDLANLRDLNLPRYHTKFSTSTRREIHTFVDASETAYAAAVYWRIVDEEGKVHVSLATAKARVAPLKLASIPRLELQAAVLGSRLAKTVAEEYQIQADRRYFWTDSRTVLKWLRSGPRVFKPFVAHRVAEIEEQTTVNEWSWIPTSHNVADDATRNVPRNFTKNHRWFIGPEFLKDAEEFWPKEKETEIETTGEERVHVVKETNTKLTEALPDITKFSSWLRLVRTTARVLQFIELLKVSREKLNYGKTSKRKDLNYKKISQNTQNSTKRNYRPLDGKLVEKAEELWIRVSQEESFAEEKMALQNHREIPKESRLRQLALVMEDSIVKLKSRIDATLNISMRQKQPAVLDGDHRYTKLYLMWLHQKLQHAGTEMIVNEARQHYWILKLRPTAKSIVKSCLKCRIEKAVPSEPPTGDHPYSRLAHHRRPFTYTGVDYFGPLTVTVGRSHPKRYVVLFTCLTTRAVHLEIAANLSTDSAIMALRRMIARRGCPTEIYSDNGTNFHGANRELQEALQDEAANNGIKWKFIPPGAPFMGGAWERLVRSVKTALYSVLEDRHPQEETLATLLCEAEYTVNNRPLTHVSISPEDDEALTPNHFLLGGSGGINRCGSFTDIDLKLRHQWRQAQRLADIFWERWIKEYLPQLQYRREPIGRGQSLQENDLVLIVDPNLPRNTWPRGKVVKLYPGQDGIVRAVDVQTVGGILRRPTKKLVVLPVSDETNVIASPE